MLSKVCSAAVNGIDAYPVEVEVNEGFGDTVIVILSCILHMRAIKAQHIMREHVTLFFHRRAATSAPFP
jgi:hypothetical protein